MQMEEQQLCKNDAHNHQGRLRFIGIARAISDGGGVSSTLFLVPQMALKERGKVHFTQAFRCLKNFSVVTLLPTTLL